MMSGEEQMLNRRALARGLAAAALGAAAWPAGSAVAQGEYPQRPVTIIVPWAPGGSSDAFGCVLAARLSTELGRTVLIDNRGGANGTIGSQQVARARPDGYTLLLSSTSTYAIAPHLYPLPYDNERGFSSAGLLAEMPFFMVVPKVSKATDFASFLEMAKRPNHGLTYGSAAIGASSHVTTEMFLGRAGLDIPEITYRGGGPMVQGLLSNEVSMVFQAASGILNFMQSGDVRALAVTTRERSRFAPEVPALAELGYPDFEAVEHLALLAPAGTPEPILRRLNAASAAALEAPETRERLDTMAVAPKVQPIEAWPAYLAAENAKWGGVIRDRNIRVQ
jgi:tripartite-type tricarboxylate transporter receptor subunit TctC